MKKPHHKLLKLRAWIAFIAAFMTAFICGCIYTGSEAPNKPSAPPKTAIASAHPLATQAGLEILAQGGNAFDAGIAVAAVLGVVEPYSAGIGGGGFWLIQPAGKNAVMIDARETAPHQLKTTDYYTNGKFDRDKAINGPLSAGIPGQPAAFAHLAKHYGNLPLSQTLASAIYYAKEGFPSNPVYHRLINWRLPVMERYPSSSHFFNHLTPPHSDDAVEQNSTLIYQKDLAKTLERIAKLGHQGFYEGELAQQLISAVNAAGGVWHPKDLSDYQVIERQPIKGTYRGLTITSAAPPSAGGILLIDMLNMLENYDLQTLTKVQRTHLITEVMRRAYKERSKHLGDPDFHPVPAARLTDKAYAKTQMADFSWHQASISEPAQPSNEGTHTTHFSILDQQGNKLSATLSINLPFGSGFVAEGTGVLLNNELDDFSLEIDGNNAYGLTGSNANALAPGKRPLSSMTPSFVENDHWLGILGTPGGSRITTMVLLGVLEAANKTEPKAWVSLPRFHHQYLPDVLEYEPGAFTDRELKEIQELGHQVKERDREYGDMQAVLWRKQPDSTVFAASDPRRIGSAVVVNIANDSLSTINNKLHQVDAF